MKKIELTASGGRDIGLIENGHVQAMEMTPQEVRELIHDIPAKNGLINALLNNTQVMAQRGDHNYTEPVYVHYLVIRVVANPEDKVHHVMKPPVVHIQATPKDTSE